MPFELLPFEARWKGSNRFVRTLFRPIRAGSTVWSEVYWGTGCGAPMAFAYLVLLLILPLVLGGGWLGLRSVLAAMGPQTVRVQVQVLLQGRALGVAPGVLVRFAAWPLLWAWVGGLVAHGVLRGLDRDGWAPWRLGVRVMGYAAAWMLPLLALVAMVRLYGLFQPLPAAMAGWVVSGSEGPSGLDLGQLAGPRVVALAGLALGTWGLTVAYQTRVWKAALAALLALAAAGAAGYALERGADRAAVRWLPGCLLRLAGPEAPASAVQAPVRPPLPAPPLPAPPLLAPTQPAPPLLAPTQPAPPVPPPPAPAQPMPAQPDPGSPAPAEPGAEPAQAPARPLYTYRGADGALVVTDDPGLARAHGGHIPRGALAIRPGTTAPSR
jgi:hypothetical protein